MVTTSTAEPRTRAGRQIARPFAAGRKSGELNEKRPYANTP